MNAPNLKKLVQDYFAAVDEAARQEKISLGSKWKQALMDVETAEERLRRAVQ